MASICMLSRSSGAWPWPGTVRAVSDGCRPRASRPGFPARGCRSAGRAAPAPARASTASNWGQSAGIGPSSTECAFESARVVAGRGLAFALVEPLAASFHPFAGRHSGKRLAAHLLDELCRVFPRSGQRDAADIGGDAAQALLLDDGARCRSRPPARRRMAATAAITMAMRPPRDVPMIEAPCRSASVMKSSTSCHLARDGVVAEIWIPLREAAGRGNPNGIDVARRLGVPGQGESEGVKVTAVAGKPGGRQMTGRRGRPDA